MLLRLCAESDGDPIAIVDKRFGIAMTELKAANIRIADFVVNRILYYMKGQNIFNKIRMLIFAEYIKHLKAIASLGLDGEKNYSPLLNALSKHCNNYMYNDILLDTIVYIYRVGRNRIDYFEINRRRIHCSTKFFFTVSMN